jgi:hypothetical protein
MNVGEGIGDFLLLRGSSSWKWMMATTARQRSAGLTRAGTVGWSAPVWGNAGAGGTGAQRRRGSGGVGPGCARLMPMPFNAGEAILLLLRTYPPSHRE